MKIIDELYTGEISGVFCDTRKAIKNGLFIPIVGENFDGNRYIKEAFLKGAKLSLVDKDFYDKNKSDLENLNIIVVENSLLYMHKLARSYIERIKPIVIGITGSVGKTTTKSILYNIVKKSYKNTIANVGNFNNLIGLPLTVLNSPKETQIMILEMGLMKNGEISKLASIARPNIAAITNIGTSHSKYFSTIDMIKKEKLSVVNYFSDKDILVINSFDDMLNSYISDKINILRSSIDYKINSLDDGYFSLKYKGNTYFPGVRGEHLYSNIILCIEISKILDIDDNIIKQGIEDYKAEEMRFSIVDLGNVKLINDAYNASSSSIIASIKTLDKMNAKRKILIIGDILELDDISEKEHYKITQINEFENIDLVISFGKYSKIISDNHKNSYHFTDIDKITDKVINIIKDGDIVLFKGSRGLKMERIIKKVEEVWK